MSDQPSCSVTERLAFVVESLYRVAAARAGRNHALIPLIVVFCPYVRRLGRRFEALLARLRAGDLAAPRSRPRTAPAEPDPAPAPDASGRSKPRKTRLPTKFAWLVDMVPEARSFGEHVRLVLADPETAALLEAFPQALRLLRPFSRMMGVAPEARLPAALFPTRRTRPPRTPKPRTRPARTKLPRQQSRGAFPTSPWVRVPSAKWPKGV